MLARTKPVPIRFKAVHPNLKRKVANLIHLTRLQLVRNSLKALTLRHQLVHLSPKALTIRTKHLTIRMQPGRRRVEPVHPRLIPVAKV